MHEPDGNERHVLYYSYKVNHYTTWHFSIVIEPVGKNKMIVASKWVLKPVVIPKDFENKKYLNPH